MFYYMTKKPVKCAWSLFNQDGYVNLFWIYRANGRPELRFLELLDRTGVLRGYWFASNMDHGTRKAWTLFITMLGSEMIVPADTCPTDHT